ncbi:MAG: patatin-like phospholipase family protein [Casimicrobiaceae bacterium]
MAWLAAAVALTLGVCATRPVNPPVSRVDLAAGYRLDTRPPIVEDKENLVILAFSGGGTCAAAFSYGVLEALRRIEIEGPRGRRIRLLDHVDLITGVSGGSFTALAYGLYGESLFGEYEQRFLKRDVEGELLKRLLSPTQWGALWSKTWGRSEMAAQLYDEILFDGATFANLERRPGPLIVATATDISTGGRLGFVQPTFDVLCSDLAAVPLSRAAAASSAVPLVLSPVTLNNYGGTCSYAMPPWLKVFSQGGKSLRPAERAIRQLKDVETYADGAERPYIHLVDGGLADNLGMRGVLEVFEVMEALKMAGRPTRLDNARRIVVFVVNAASSPKTNWDRSEAPPGDLQILLRASGVPIAHYSFDAIELLKDTMVRWQNLREIRNSVAAAGLRDPVVTRLTNVPDARIYAIDVSFAALDDASEREYLNNLPTSLVLPPEAVDRLRAAAGTIVLQSPEFKRLLHETGARLVETPAH